MSGTFDAYDGRERAEAMEMWADRMDDKLAALRVELAAAQAEAGRLRESLAWALPRIRAFESDVADVVRCSDVLSRAPGSREALRAMMMKACEETRYSAEVRGDAILRWDESASAIIARLLGEEGGER